MTDEYLLHIGKLAAALCRKFMADDDAAYLHSLENDPDFVRQECKKTAAWLRMGGR